MDLLVKYKGVFLFLIKFFTVYAVGSWMYGEFLSIYSPALDPFTRFVTAQSADVLSLFLDNIRVEYFDDKPFAEIYEAQYILLKVIEGCNSISVFVLFVSFIVAFNTKWVNYLWFIPSAASILHIANILRIAMVGYVYYYYNHMTELVHDYLFPAIIYGTVLLLWVVWVKYIVHGKK